MKKIITIIYLFLLPISKSFSSNPIYYSPYRKAVLTCHKLNDNGKRKDDKEYTITIEYSEDYIHAFLGRSAVYWGEGNNNNISEKFFADADGNLTKIEGSNVNSTLIVYTGREHIYDTVYYYKLVYCTYKAKGFGSYVTFYEAENNQNEYSMVGNYLIIRCDLYDSKNEKLIENYYPAMSDYDKLEEFFSWMHIIIN